MAKEVAGVLAGAATAVTMCAVAQRAVVENPDSAMRVQFEADEGGQRPAHDVLPFAAGRSISTSSSNSGGIAET